MNAQPIPMIKLFSLSLALAVSANAADWERLPPLPEPNGGFICGSQGKHIVIIGGTNWEGGKKNWLSAIHEFDPAKLKWEKAKDLQEGPYAYGTALQSGSHLAFLGGTNGEKPLRIFAGVDGIKTVMSRELDLPRTVVLSAGGWIGNKVIMVGGTDDAANIAGVSKSTVLFEPNTRERLITQAPDYPGRPFAVAASAVVGDELFVFGGMNYDDANKAPVNSREAHSFSIQKNTWRTLKPLPTPSRGLSAVTLDESHVYLAGGFTDAFTAEAQIYDVKSDTYRPAKPLPYAAMVGLVVHDGFVYCLGGEDKMKSRTDQFYRIPITELSH